MIVVINTAAPKQVLAAARAYGADPLELLKIAYLSGS